MKNKPAFFVFCLIAVFLLTQTAVSQAQGIQDNPAGRNSPPVSNNEISLPLNRVVIFSSGLAFYQHSGSVNGSVSMNIPFRLNAINDALKSLVINDPASANPSVVYQAENTLTETLRSLIIDFSDSPDMATMLLRLRGAEVVISTADSTAETFTGRIIGVENRPVSNNMFTGLFEPFLLLNTREGMMPFNLKDVNTIRFTDNAIERDLTRALDLIAASRNSNSRNLTLNLPGTARRNVQVSYVIPSPVWKVSYRLDLGAARPLLQGWAIVDNDSDTDWNNVELSLVAGRPVSFIQELYPPYYVNRPVLPLAIAGTADGIAHERGAGMPMPSAVMAPDRALSARSSIVQENAMNDSAAFNLAGGTVQTAEGTDAGGQFEFTIRNPITLNRQMSAMFPLVESPIEARKTLIYRTGRHPRLGAELTNTTGMRLPAGPITVFDQVYAGDALIEFWNENEKRFISYGEDLSVTASSGFATSNVVSSVNVSGGVMTINRNVIHSRTYTFINSGSARQLTVEHVRTQQTELVSPQASEQTPSIYRFNITLAANGQTELTVREQRPVMERITLLSQRLDILLSYSANQEIPANVRSALQRAADLRRSVDAADTTIRNIEAQRERLTADQDRTRRNLEAAGNQTPQGQDFLRRLVSLDSEIDALSVNLERANAEARAARVSFENYLNNLNL